MNYLLIISEENIDIIENYMSKSIQASRDTLITPLVVFLLILLLFILIAIRFIINLSKEYPKFRNILFTIHPEEATKIELTLTMFQEFLKDCSGNSVKWGSKLN